MWWHCLARPTTTLTQDQHNCKRSSTSINMHNCTTSKVQCTAFEQPTIGTKDPVSNNWIHKNAPHADQHCVRAELHAISSCTGNKCWRDDSKHHLIGEERKDRNNKTKVTRVSRQFRNLGEIFHEDEVEVADVLTATSKGQTESDGCPDHAD